MAGAIEKTGLAPRIALYILHSAGSRSLRVYWGVFLVMLILTFLVPSITARTLLMLPILLGIGEAFGAKPDSRIMRGLLFIIAMSGTALSIGILTAHVGNPTTVALIQKATGQEISWAGWLKVGFPPALLLGVISVLMISYVWKPEVADIGVGTAFVLKELARMEQMS